MAYAEHTKVTFEKTVSDIIMMLRKAGAMQIGQMEEAGRLTVLFTMTDRHVRFRVTWDERSDRSKRQRARALLLVIKAKLESVESQVESFEEAFFANVVLADGQTTYERLREPLALEYREGKPTLALAGPQ